MTFCVCTFQYTLYILPPDHVLSLQQCNLLQRHHTPYWLQLAEAYATLHSLSIATDCCNSAGVEFCVAKFSNLEANFSNSAPDNEPVVTCSHHTRHVGTAVEPQVIFSNMETIISNTVALFRPYFKWKISCPDKDHSMDFKSHLATVSALLGKQVSVEAFVKDLHQLSWEHHQQLLGLLFQVSSCCCLIWAK